MTATGMAGGLPVTRQAVAKHLAVMERAGLVAGERSGREVRWSVVPAGGPAGVRVICLPPDAMPDALATSYTGEMFARSPSAPARPPRRC